MYVLYNVIIFVVHQRVYNSYKSTILQLKNKNFKKTKYNTVLFFFNFIFKPQTLY